MKNDEIIKKNIKNKKNSNKKNENQIWNKKNWWMMK